MSSIAKAIVSTEVQLERLLRDAGFVDISVERMDESVFTLGHKAQGLRMPLSELVAPLDDLGRP